MFGKENRKSLLKQENVMSRSIYVTSYLFQSLQNIHSLPLVLRQRQETLKYFVVLILQLSMNRKLWHTDSTQFNFQITLAQS